jgi:hypothetical protein
MSSDPKSRPISKRRRVSWQDGISIDDEGGNGGKSAPLQKTDEKIESSKVKAP